MIALPRLLRCPVLQRITLKVLQHSSCKGDVARLVTGSHPLFVI